MGYGGEPVAVVEQVRDLCLPSKVPCVCWATRRHGPRAPSNPATAASWARGGHTTSSATATSPFAVAAAHHRRLGTAHSAGARQCRHARAVAVCGGLQRGRAVSMTAAQGHRPRHPLRVLRPCARAGAVLPHAHGQADALCARARSAGARANITASGWASSAQWLHVGQTAIIAATVTP